MDTIKAVLFEPVGCLAEFRPAAFIEAARELFGVIGDPAAGASQAYWRLLELLADGWQGMSAESRARLIDIEVAAVEQCELYEDVASSLQQLQSMEVRAYLVSSLSRQAVDRFITRFSLAEMLTGSVARDESDGVTSQPLIHAIKQGALEPRQAIALADTAEALEVAKQQGVNALLMINDYDEGRALSERHPAGGIVSFAELPDLLALIQQRAGLRSAPPLPRTAFELFEPG